MSNEQVIEQQNDLNLEQGKGLRNFRTSADVENFYRFVNENNLRREAKMIFEFIYNALTGGKKKKKSKSSKKVQ